jgi:hypothetical protein
MIPPVFEAMVNIPPVDNLSIAVLLTTYGGSKIPSLEILENFMSATYLDGMIVAISCDGRNPLGNASKDTITLSTPPFKS